MQLRAVLQWFFCVYGIMQAGLNIFEKGNQMQDVGGLLVHNLFWAITSVTKPESQNYTQCNKKLFLFEHKHKEKNDLSLWVSRHLNIFLM